jgi:hypothetical protein
MIIDLAATYFILAITHNQSCALSTIHPQLLQKAIAFWLYKGQKLDVSL